MYRTKTCGELRLTDAGQQVTLAGWVQRTRKMGGMTFVDLRDRYGLTQLVFDESKDAALCEQANKLGREWCVQVTGQVSERQAKNPKMPTGDIEILAQQLNVLSESQTPPFTIEDNTDGGDDIRMKYRYLDLRRTCVRKNLELRHRMTILIRNFLDNLNFIEVETPILIGSTPEGARDFVVPSRMNPGQFYALPQSPQTLKQLLMVSGFDRYFQIAKCFRDEDLRADRYYQTYPPVSAVCDAVLDGGLPACVIYDHVIASDELYEYPVILIPGMKYISPQNREAISRYMERGGSVVVYGTEACRLFAEVKEISKKII